ncbi:hypothetical protein BK634_24100 [Pseudomonas chlororaphis]|uniref:SMI1/KNR4 family protein n=1 Tax=Pseudomonas morbosilactucae TaxID=2938197 RepID=A0ABT0JHW5_9PSED|nr:hypothetical protein [Pseudomonas morbosilactucae]MCK9815507.1 hypothetical protein [Pseudomonas morbosilactucae]ROL65901.1 hypothetical protein BK634_24100 [Pseudomonas chlororaphis]WEK08310.1 MAG: hypothetical protein P0Y51_24555 [Pseudomonas sp.]
MTFTDEITAAFPAANPLPPLLRQALVLLEEQGCVRTRRDGGRYMTLHPEPEYSDIATTSFHVPEPADTAVWTASKDPEVNRRLVIFLRTGGDGSWAGLWRDDQGQQRMVHLGSGSGSVMLCVLTRNMEDLLRLLAIGYDELCWPEQFQQTPDEVREEEYGDGDYPPPPRLFRAHVEQTLGLSIPARAADIVPTTVSMDDRESDDPFWNWLKQVRGE